MLELAIIADDLTGALDAAAPFAMRGIETAVALSPAALEAAIGTGVRVVSVSTDSRDLGPDAASTAVRQALAAIPAGTPLFKKVDSRLKGNVAAELDAFDYTRSLVVPAIPAFGRIQRGSEISGFGVEVPIAIAARLATHAARAVVPDVDSDADLEQALQTPADLLVGARGLAEALAKRLAPDATPAKLAYPDTQAFCVIGSTDPITLGQLEHLRLHADPLVIAAPNGAAQDGSIAAKLTVLQATPGTGPTSGRAVADALAASLGRLSPPTDALLVLSGGATAQRILETLGISMLTLVGEALPGLPMARAGGLTVVTKSGGFGPEDTLTRLLEPYFSVRSSVRSHVG